MSEYEFSVGDAAMPTERANAFTILLLDFLPLFCVAFAILMAKGLNSLRTAYKGGSWFAVLSGVFLSSTVGAALAVGCAALLPLIGLESNDELMMGVTVFMAVGGMRLIDALLQKHLGLRVIDAGDAGDVQSQWAELSPEDKARAMRLWHEKRKGVKE